MKFKLVLRDTISILKWEDDETNLRELVKFLETITDIEQTSSDLEIDTYSFKSSSYFDTWNNTIEFSTVEELMDFEQKIWCPIKIYTEKQERILEINI